MSLERINYLFNQYGNKTATEAEKEELFNWVNDPVNHDFITSFFVVGIQSEPGIGLNREDWQPLLQQILRVLPAPRSTVWGRLIVLRKVAVAAAIVAVIACAWWLMVNDKGTINNTKPAKPQLAQDLLPGSNRATLTLVDGTKILLDSIANGTLTPQGNTKLIKLDGQLAYSAQDVAGSKTTLSYNTVNIPRGGQYQLVLSDGTKVWLNAASSLRFPVAFTGKERRVELTGEGYFEVAALNAKYGQSKMPFKVVVMKPSGVSAEVDVLGTSFNVNAYLEEEALKTTLLNGSIKISKGDQVRLLKPGQQAVISNKANVSTIGLQTANIEEVIAWKEGRFYFNSTPLTAVMRQIERWYDVEVLYDKDDLASLTFSGVVGRMNNISQVLRMLELTGVIRFEIENKKIHVYRLRN